MQIFPGAVLENSAGRRCAVGPVIRCEGNWYTFVPAYVFEGEKKVFQAGTGLLVGEIVADHRPGDDNARVDVTEIVRLVRFFAYAPVQVEKSLRVRQADPMDFLGQKVLKRDGMATTAGRVVSVDGPFSLATPDGGVKTYDGAVSVKSEHEEVVIAQKGDGGASIISPLANALVGVLIGVAGGECYCVPGNALIARYFPGFDNLDMVA
ncbi:hypothetical protein [Rhizobium sp. BK176]|uniref:hypothetical protein n=1 Tax=Rhizobium sp. BK176 TaxID=2587071 RepID=UPI002167FC18|nr:hypothetical protein [Rhizobium sp. BK176]MCS4089935.1 hypothetical protein [Rhizobium sp. BK176]